ncbi:MAG: DegT/DnrJ/EryC1/StrS aminotransferase family protein [Catenulispora sp.]|nr:DegT/DnrJ/EryC1/StrS aminotransferase family protein [Catenulispora sp.]
MTVPAARIVFDGADREAVAAAVVESLATGALTLGPQTERFETAFAAAHRARHAVAVATGTAALEIALRVAGVANHDVVVPANTFYATAAAVVHAGARPVFADVDAATFALTAATVQAALTPSTKAVVLVHIGGLITPQVPAIRELCDRRGIVLVEDAAHAHGCSLDGQMAGTFGLAGAFSFYPTKVTTSGEGGMIITDSAEVQQEARIYRDQGKGAFTANHHVRDGASWRLSELNAAAGAVHVQRLAEFVRHRRAVAARYLDGLAGVEALTPLAEPPGCVGNFYKFIVLLPQGADRTRFKSEIADRFDVRLSGEVYDLPLHKQPVLMKYANGALPVAEDVCARHVCLPVHSDMRDDEVDQVLAAVTAVSGEMFG